MDLSIVIPAYNEEARIGQTLDAYTSVCSSLSFEIIVVVNGSDDGTVDRVRERAEFQTGSLRLIEVPDPIGKGGAVLRGFRECTGAKVAYVDADGSTPPESLFALAEHLQSSGICIGSRWLPGSVVGTRQPLSRRIASRSFNPLVRAFFGLQVTDTQCGAKVLSRDVMEAILPEVGCTQWAFDVELLFQVRRAGFPVKEHPIHWNDTQGSKVRLFRTSVEMILALTRLRLHYSPFRPVVDLWDNTLGRKLFDRRMQHMRTIHHGSGHEG